MWRRIAAASSDHPLEGFRVWLWCLSWLESISAISADPSTTTAALRASMSLRSRQYERTYPRASQICSSTPLAEPVGTTAEHSDTGLPEFHPIHEASLRACWDRRSPHISRKFRRLSYL